jgi:phosphodiester glycosidase/flagellar hook capping protein FlgD
VLRLVVALSILVAMLTTYVATAAAQTATPLFPGVTYENGVQFTPHGPVSIRVVRGPRPVGLYRLRTVLSNESVLREETLSSMQKRLASQATMVGVNGDFSRIRDGKPSGIMLRDGVLVTPPNSQRSSLGISLDGALDVRRVRFLGTWRGTGQRRSVNEFNDAPGKNGIALFTSDWGRSTPRVQGSVAVVLEPFPASVPNADLVAPVVATAQGGAPVSLAPGRAVLVARGNAAAKLQAEAPTGTALTLRLILQPDWGVVSDAVGGGPVLVRDGKPVYSANEAFTVSQIAPRHPRTAVGQTADGRLIFAVVDGRQPGYSVGMTTFEMALTMVRLGAVRAMQLDGGGSSTLAFDGRVLNSPSDGRERPVPTALMLQYYGVYAPPPLEQVVSPNGDGVAETQELSFKIVRPSATSTTLTSPDGATAWQEVLDRGVGTYEVAFPPAPVPPPEGTPSPQPATPVVPAEGRWTLTVTALDDQGLSSTTTRRFWVNSTLASLRIAPARVIVRPTGGRAEVRWTQARAARVKVTIETPEGVVVRTVSSTSLQAGEQSVTWDGRAGNRRPVGTGRYIARLTATNELGAVSLTQFITVRRVAR